jgi:adenine-specific DNA-methyltransferase
MPTLDWLNRDAAFRIAAEVPYRMLELVSEHRSEKADQLSDVSPNSSGQKIDKRSIAKNNKNDAQAQLNWANGESAKEEGQSSSTPAPTHDNLLIQGDNLEALKALLPFYRGQVKCIFIDPPYNTKSAFEHYDDNLEHAQWLTMMLPRLQLLRELLSGDGSIWVTIDDNEGHYLKVLMDEVFGRGNFVANVVWQKKYAVANDHKTIAPMHDHLLVYRKSSVWQRNLLERDDSKDRLYRYEDARGQWRPDNYTCSKTADERPNLFYPVIQPSTGEEIWPKRTRVWAFSQEQHQIHVAEDMLYWGRDGNGRVPSIKRYKHLLRQDGIVPQSLWTHDFAGNTDASRKETRLVLGTESLADDFLTPKPELLLSRVLSVATDPNDLILDSFLGSGTTAAVAQKMNRRWIGIEMGDHAQTHCVPRLQKVIDGEQGGISKAVNWQGGGSFRFMKLGATIFDETGAINPEVRFATLAAFIWMQETTTPWKGSPPPSRGRLGGGWGSIGSASNKPHPHPSPPLEGEGMRLAHTPLLGTHLGVDYFLLYNGILGDKRPQAGNVLTSAVLQDLNEQFPSAGRARVIYGEATRLGEMRLANERITFKQIPYDVGNQ